MVNFPGSRLAGLKFFHVIANLIFSVFHRRAEILASRASPAKRASPPHGSHVIGPLNTERAYGADYMSRAGPVSRAGSVYRDDCSAQYYMRRASPPAAKFRSCSVKRWLQQRAWTKCFYFRQLIILAYYFQFYVALWSDKPLCVI